MWWTLLILGAFAKDIYRATLPDGRTVFTDQRRDASAELYLIDTPSKVLVAPVNTRGVPLLDAWDDRFVDASLRYGVAAELLKAVCLAESAMNPSARSNKGAMGLMQLMPGTADGLGVADPWDPDQNIDGGARYIKQMLDEFRNTRSAVAAYHAGPGNVEKYGGIPPFQTTQVYVDRVMRFYDHFLHTRPIVEPFEALDPG
jgi:soluble lytic murein transglycosylase-like protein